MPGEIAALLKMCGISKQFPGVKALDGVSFDLHKGEVHALVGENGAGKSTLIKILSGAYRPDSGTLHLEDYQAHRLTPVQARQRGIFTIYQENILVPDLSVAENIFIGQEPGGRGAFDWKTAYVRSEEMLQQLNVRVSPWIPARRLGIAEQQAVQICKALVLQSKVIIMDEPTASFGRKEVENLFSIIRSLKALGKGIVFISHHLDEVFEISDRITVLRDGKHVATHPTSQVYREALISEMVGRPFSMNEKKERLAPGECALEALDFCWKNRIHNVSFTVRQGEILGIYGLVGAGRTELAKLMIGSVKRDSGKLIYNGRELDTSTPLRSLRSGVCLITEDRQQTGLFIGRDVKENITIAGLSRTRGPIIRPGQDRDTARKFVDSLNIKTPSIFTIVKNLSGGNQQKVVLSKWLHASCQIYLFDEPTRGVDVGAKEEIYRIFEQLLREGKIIVVFTSDLEELLHISDRVLIMRDGRVSAEFTGDGCTQKAVLSSCLEGK